MLFSLLFLYFFVDYTKSVELTFELQDSTKQCFYEELKKGVKLTVDYQVMLGGNYDVDVEIKSPYKQKLYSEQKRQMDSVIVEANEDGPYSICFSNEFSTFTDKLVYMDIQRDDEDKLPGISDHLTAMTQMEVASAEIHDQLKSVSDEQAHHRVQETFDRKRAEDLNSRVFLWSLSISLIIPVISLVQVWILKNFFAEKKPFLGSI